MNTDDEIVNELRRKQIELVDAQIRVQNRLWENAEIEALEARERFMKAKAERLYAELKLERDRREMAYLSGVNWNNF